MLKIVCNYLFGLTLGFLIMFKCSSFNFNYDYQNNDNGYYLSIPKINLKEKFYSFDDKNNDVNKGIYLATDYDFNKMDKPLILASHSGNSFISFFKNLDKLNINDIYIIDINNNRYFFKIDKIYKIKKTGKFKYRDEKYVSYLITCDKKNKDKQIVFKAKMIKNYKKSTFF